MWFESLRTNPKYAHALARVWQAVDTLYFLSYPYRWWAPPGIVCLYLFSLRFRVWTHVHSQAVLGLAHFAQWPVTPKEMGDINFWGGHIVSVCGVAVLFWYLLQHVGWRQWMLTHVCVTPTQQAVFRHFVQQAFEDAMFVFTMRQAVAVMSWMVLPPQVVCASPFGSLGWMRYVFERACVLLCYVTASLVWYAVGVRLLLMPVDRVGHSVVKYTVRAMVYVAVAMLRIYPLLNANGVSFAAALLHMLLRYPLLTLALGFCAVEPVEWLGFHIRQNFDVTPTTITIINLTAVAASQWSTTVGMSLARGFIQYNEAWPDLNLIMELAVRVALVGACAIVLWLYANALYTVYVGMPLFICDFDQPRVNGVQFLHGGTIVDKIKDMYSTHLAEHINAVVRESLPASGDGEEAAGAGVVDSRAGLASIGAALQRISTRVAAGWTTTTGAAGSVAVVPLPEATASHSVSSEAGSTAQEQQSQENAAGAASPALFSAMSEWLQGRSSQDGSGSRPGMAKVVSVVRDLLHVFLGIRSMLNGQAFVMEVDGTIRARNPDTRPLNMPPATVIVEASSAPSNMDIFSLQVGEHARRAHMKRLLTISMGSFSVPGATSSLQPAEAQVRVLLRIYVHVDAIIALAQDAQRGWHLYNLTALLVMPSALLPSCRFSVPLLTWLARSWAGIGLLDPIKAPKSLKSERDRQRRLAGLIDDIATKRANVMIAELRNMPPAVQADTYRLLAVLARINSRGNAAAAATAQVYRSAVGESRLPGTDDDLDGIGPIEGAGAGSASPPEPVFDASLQPHTTDTTPDAQADALDMLTAVFLVCRMYESTSCETANAAQVLKPVLYETAMTLTLMFYHRLMSVWQAGKSPTHVLALCGLMAGLQGLLHDHDWAAYAANNPNDAARILYPELPPTPPPGPLLVASVSASEFPPEIRPTPARATSATRSGPRNDEHPDPPSQCYHVSPRSGRGASVADGGINHPGLGFPHVKHGAQQLATSNPFDDFGTSPAWQPQVPAQHHATVSESALDIGDLHGGQPHIRSSFISPMASAPPMSAPSSFQRASEEPAPQVDFADLFAGLGSVDPSGTPGPETKDPTDSNSQSVISYPMSVFTTSADAVRRRRATTESAGGFRPRSSGSDGQGASGPLTASPARATLPSAHRPQVGMHDWPEGGPNFLPGYWS